MAESVKRLRTGAKRALQGAIDYSLMPKRLDFEAAASSDSSESEAVVVNVLSLAHPPKIKENCDPLPALNSPALNSSTLNSPTKLTPPNRPSHRPVPNIRLHSGFMITTAKKPRGIRLFEQREQQNRLQSAVATPTDSWVITSPVTAPKPKLHPRLLFSPEDPNRRRTAPLPGGRHWRRGQGWDADKKVVRKSRLANINPFTPTSLNITSSLKRARLAKQSLGGMFTPTSNGSFDHEDLQRTLEQFMADQGKESGTSKTMCPPPFPQDTIATTPNNNTTANSPEIDTDIDSPLNPSKRLRISDINIARYEEEFIELHDIATGVFGQVKIARHRLDGMVYAIKVTRSEIVGNNQERAAMNEVFAHAALMKHKHVVRYYNSWVENGRIYIQNEYCEGGSLANLIKKKREEGNSFSENELKRITTHLAKGLQYIHSKSLVHLDIKPENIFIALDHLTASASDNDDGDAEGEATTSSTTTSDEDDEVNDAATKENSSPEGPDASMSHASMKESSAPSVQGTPKSSKAVVNDSTDSGNASDGTKKCKEMERVSYKLGDLGHVAQINGDYIPEEGDCRYFAPELLLHDVDREKLPKADIFSLGLTLYECATLMSLPKNSEDDPIYQKIRSGNIPHLTGFSKEFNQLIKLTTDPDVMSRPSAGRILSHPFVKNLGKKSQSNLLLYKELKSTRQKLKELESQIAKAKGTKRLVGRGTKKSKSSYQ